MLITKRSVVSGIDHTLDIPVTQEQLDAWKRGALIQDAMPNLTADQREFIMTGITAEEWDATFSEDDGTPPPAECKADLAAYVKYLAQGAVNSCVAIEKKYGCFGLTPQQVCEELAFLAEEG